MSIFPESDDVFPLEDLPKGQGQTAIVPSTEQQAIYAWFRKDQDYFTVDPVAINDRYDLNVNGNLVVVARAGTGKTFTIVNGVNQAPERFITLMAFNSRIAKELQYKITNPNARTKTIHGTGYGFVLREWPNVQVERGIRRAAILADAACNANPRRAPTGVTIPTPFDVRKLVTKLHTKAREIHPHAEEKGQLRNLAIDMDCEPDEAMERAGFDLHWIEARALEAMELAASVRPVECGIDFADQIFLPIRNRWLRQVADLVVIDEAQDMTLTQLEIAVGICRGRICVVGDDRQAIYGWRGAASDSLTRLKRELSAPILGLKTTYRCGHKIVELAQTMVPDIRAAEGNPDGEIRDIRLAELVKQAEHGDFILSRVNAPLVSIALQLLIAGKKAQIAGKDIGKGLVDLLDKLKARSVPDLLTKIVSWEKKQIAHLKKSDREDLIPETRDKAEVLSVIARASKSVMEVSTRLVNLFTDEGLGALGIITCSSVHKSKGLEADRVFVLEWTLQANRGGDREEENIKYVAVTRAKRELVWVHE